MLNKSIAENGWHKISAACHATQKKTMGNYRVLSNPKHFIASTFCCILCEKSKFAYITVQHFLFIKIHPSMQSKGICRKPLNIMRQ